MNKSVSRAMRATAVAVGITVSSAIFAGTAVAASPGAASAAEMTHGASVPADNDFFTPGSDADSNPYHNYHEDLKPNSNSNSNSNSSLAQCGAGNDDTISRDECKEENIYDHRYRHKYVGHEHDRDDKGGRNVFDPLF